jgi:hypothetical protein
MGERPGFRGAFILRGRRRRRADGSLEHFNRGRRRFDRPSGRACRCRLIGLGELRARSRQWRAGRRRGRSGALGRPAGRHPLGAGPSRVRTVVVRSHDDPSRWAHHRHAVAWHRHRHDPHDAPHLSVDDDSNLLAAGIERARHIDRTLAHRAAQGLEPGRTHDCRNLLGRQPSAVVGRGIVARCNWLSRSRSRSEDGKSEGGSADRDLCFQDRTPRCDLRCVSRRPPSRGANRNPIKLAHSAQARGLPALNDSREWGVAWAQRCHHRARTISIKRSTSSAVVANEVTRRTSVPSRAGAVPSAGAGIAHG